MIHFQRSQSTVFSRVDGHEIGVRPIFEENSSFSKTRSNVTKKETGPFSPQPGYAHTLHMSGDPRGPENGS